MRQNVESGLELGRAGQQDVAVVTRWDLSLVSFCLHVLEPLPLGTQQHVRSLSLLPEERLPGGRDFSSCGTRLSSSSGYLGCHKQSTLDWRAIR